MEKLWSAKVRNSIKHGRGFAFLYAEGLEDAQMDALTAYVAYLRECGFAVKEVMSSPQTVLMYRVKLTPEQPPCDRSAQCPRHGDGRILQIMQRSGLAV